MGDPVILVETGQCYERANIRKWFYMGGDTCPLTGCRLRSTELVADAALQARIILWTANRSLDLAGASRRGGRQAR
ncbi:hypothetical protein WJX81_000777 [Elliptochloris bilobata]|uniref:U-box domain-containing protein n=1 Tax=Elliptochloris bilobata TaxID=381761 RepID=A0AAW1RT47_9CHLO